MRCALHLLDSNHSGQSVSTRCLGLDHNAKAATSELTELIRDDTDGYPPRLDHQHLWR
jgi:hypothetical protein